LRRSSPKTPEVSCFIYFSSLGFEDERALETEDLNEACYNDEAPLAVSSSVFPDENPLSFLISDIHFIKTELDYMNSGYAGRSSNAELNKSSAS